MAGNQPLSLDSSQTANGGRNLQKYLVVSGLRVLSFPEVV